MDVTVREIRQKGGPRDDTGYSGPLMKLFVILAGGKRVDARLTKKRAMDAAKEIANGSPIKYEPCTLSMYGAGSGTRKR